MLFVACHVISDYLPVSTRGDHDVQAGEEIQFWKLTVVMANVGLSKSEIYRQMKEGRFPPSRSYRHDSKRKFWLSTEVRAWQADVLGTGDDLDGLFG